MGDHIFDISRTFGHFTHFFCRKMALITPESIKNTNNDPFMSMKFPYASFFSYDEITHFLTVYASTFATKTLIFSVIRLASDFSLLRLFSGFIPFDCTKYELQTPSGSKVTSV